MARPSDSYDDDPYDPDPPADAPNGLVLIGVWALFGLPLLFAVPVLLAGEAGGFAALMRVIAGGYVLIAGYVLWDNTRRYVRTPRHRARTNSTDGPDDDDEEDVFDEDAEEI